MNLLKSRNDSYPIEFVAAIDQWLICHLCGKVQGITVKAIYPKNTTVVCITCTIKMREVIIDSLRLHRMVEGGAE